MDDLATRMRAAAGSPPPTRIDLDALISGELRRRRTLRWASGAAAVAAVVTLAIAAPALYLPGSGAGGSALGPGAAPTVTGSGTAAAGSDPARLCAPLSPSPTGPQPPLQSHGTVREHPTEPVSAAVPRLTEALRFTLRNMLPPGMTVESLQQGCAEPQFQYDPSRREYALSARIRDQQGTGSLVIRVMPASGGERGSCSSPSLELEMDCRQEPDGTVVLTQTFDQFVDTKGRQYQVFLMRPDGVAVWLMSNNMFRVPGDSQTLTRPEPLLTIEHLVQIGQTPGLTLYP